MIDYELNWRQWNIVHIFNGGFGKFYCPNFRHDPPSGFVVEWDAEPVVHIDIFRNIFPRRIKSDGFYRLPDEFIILL